MTTGSCTHHHVPHPEGLVGEMLRSETLNPMRGQLCSLPPACLSLHSAVKFSKMASVFDSLAESSYKGKQAFPLLLEVGWGGSGKLPRAYHSHIGKISSRVLSA